jgi:hypothetical protein
VLKVAQKVVNLLLIVLEAVVVLLHGDILHDDGLERLPHSDGRHKGQAIHHFHQIFELDKDCKPLLLNVSPDSLFLMEVAAL